MNVLTHSGIVRRDLRTSLGTGNTAASVPLTLNLKLVHTNAGCAALAGYAVYLWHCIADGNYSLYSASTVTFQKLLRGAVAAHPLRGVPVAGGHPSASSKVQTSQLALPEATCREVYAAPGYSASVDNPNRISLARDNVFSDGAGTQTPAITGSASARDTAHLTVRLARLGRFSLALPPAAARRRRENPRRPGRPAAPPTASARAGPAPESRRSRR